MDIIIQPPPPFQTVSVEEITINGMGITEYNSYMRKIIENELWHEVDTIVVENEIGWFEAMIFVANNFV